jgi:hypothetical protein
MFEASMLKEEFLTPLCERKNVRGPSVEGIMFEACIKKEECLMPLCKKMFEAFIQKEERLRPLCVQRIVMCSCKRKHLCKRKNV